MAVTTDPSREKKKGKKPPTFQHLPRDRAAKLKKEWIEKAKVRSKWNSQKRREDVASTSMRRDAPPHQGKEATGFREGGDETVEDNDHSDEEFQGFSVEEGGEKGPERSGPKTSRGKERGGEGKVRFAPKSGPSLPSRDRDRRQFKERSHLESEKGTTDADARDSEPKPSLRDLTRAAYSPASLHNVKSSQRHRNKSWDRGQGAPDQRKGGQPNMRLRMEAMLERIKKDYT